MSLDNTARLPTPAPDEYAGDLRKTNIAPDFWYPIARARDLKAGKLLAAGFAGSPIVLARTKSGELLALEDRCAHRQVPLHVGVVAGNAIRCGYHDYQHLVKDYKEFTGYTPPQFFAIDNGSPERVFGDAET